MSSFWELAEFEYKKILRKKSTAIVLLVTLVLTVLSCGAVLFGDVYVDGVPVESQWEEMQTDRAYSRALAGRPIDQVLLLEMSAAYEKVPIEGIRYTETEEYNRYARPYSNVYAIARIIYNSPEEPFGVIDAQILTEEKAASFYDERKEGIVEQVDSLFASDRAKERLLELDSQVKTPFIYGYVEGYTRFFAIMYSTGILTSLVVAILLAPLFSGEYTSGADQLILSTKYGKGKLILAKIFTGMTLAGGIGVVLTIITYMQCMFTYGFDGAQAPLQILLPESVYPLTMGTAALHFSLCIVMGILFVAALTMLFSAKMKTSFGVIVTMGVFIIVPMFISDPERSALISNLLSLAPTYMMAFWNMTTIHLFELGGIVVEPYIFIPIFAGAATLLLLPFAHRGFRDHQIG